MRGQRDKKEEQIKNGNNLQNRFAFMPFGKH